MKTASTDYETVLASGNAILGELYQSQLVDGTIFRYTTMDRDVIYGGNRYTSTPPGLIERGDRTEKRGVETSAMSFKVHYDNTAVDAGLNFGQTVTALRWRNAIVTLYRAAWSPPGMGLPYPLTFNADGSITAPEAVTMGVWISTQPQVDRGTATIVLATPNEKFNQKVPWRGYGPQCRWTLFDVGCTLNKDNFAVNGSVLTGSSTSEIITSGLLINAAAPDAGTAPPTGYFDQGVIRFTSGANNGLSATIKSFLGAGSVNTYPNIVIADKPLAYYRLNADVNDSSGNGYNADNHGVTFSASGGPLSGGSGYGIFNGSSNYFNITSSGTPVPKPRNQANYLGGVSMECFFKVSSSSQPDGLFNSGVVGNGADLNSQLPGALSVNSSTQFPAPVVRWGQYHPAAAFTPILNQWTYLVIVFRGSRYIDVYLNGFLAATTADRGGVQPDNYLWGPFVVGKGYNVTTSTKWFSGDLSEFAIYPYAMDPGQVLTHYNASQNPVNPTNQDIQVVLPFPNTPAVGDTFTAWPGCSKGSFPCTNKFDNFINFGGTPDTPPIEASA